jgi:hypothetical protein
MHCDTCRFWVTCRFNTYEDGSVIETFKSPSGQGYCEQLKMDTQSDFGCNKYEEGGHEVITAKSGAPWQNWHFGPCPDCKGVGCHMVELRPACMHCAGLGKVRYYDDGYIADKSWDHPKEKEIKRRLREQGIKDQASLTDPGLILAEATKKDEGAFEGGTL